MSAPATPPHSVSAFAEIAVHAKGALRRLPASLLALGWSIACSPPADYGPAAISLVDRFDEATVVGSPEVAPPPPIEWRFDETESDGADEDTDSATLGSVRRR